MRLLLVLFALARLALASPVQAVREQQPNDAPAARPAEAASGVPADDFGPRQAVLEKPWFRFYSHFGFNLYDAVLEKVTVVRRTALP